MANFIRVCCGPRCGQEPGHRVIYAAAEAVCPEFGEFSVRPVLCQGLCGMGVTVVFPDGTTEKARGTKEVRLLIAEYIARTQAPEKPLQY
ncbi:MAG: hypothetical protein OHK0029_35320 [Armatimonadaceae bacterium]